MSDLISRQAVIDRINKLIEVEKKQGTDDWGYGRERVNAYEAMLHMVESEYLHPSVEPERKPGEWLIVEENAEWFEGIKGTVIKCRDCHFIHTIPHNAEMYNFCPKCGRRMKVENVYTKTTDSPADAEERRETDDNKK